MQEILDVPVGLIHSSWGGSAIEPWISDEVISKLQSFGLDAFDLSYRTNRIPTVLFNAMINPIPSFNIKGAIWCQGE